MNTYQFHYPNSNVTQQKVLMPHSEWIRIKNIESDKIRKKELQLLTNGNEWFTDESPLFDAIKTGFIKSPSPSIDKTYPCVVTKID